MGYISGIVYTGNISVTCRRICIVNQRRYRCIVYIIRKSVGTRGLPKALCLLGYIDAHYQEPERIVRPGENRLSRTNLVAISIALCHKLQPVGNALRRIFGMMGNKQQLCLAFANQHINETAYYLTIQRVQPL